MGLNNAEMREPYSVSAVSMQVRDPYTLDGSRADEGTNMDMKTVTCDISTH